MAHPSYNKDVYPQLQMPLYDFMKYHYINRNMSDIDIIKMIQDFTGIKFSRETLSKWHKRTGIPARSPKMRFRLAINEGKIKHKEIARKAGKTARENRAHFNLNIVKQRPAKYLKKRLKEKNISQAQLARHLGVSTGCIHNWCSGDAWVSPCFWKPIENFLGLPHNNIFTPSTRPANVAGVLSELFNTSRSNIYRWIKGKHIPRDKAIRKAIDVMMKKERRRRANSTA